MEIIFPDETDKRGIGAIFKVLLKFGKSKIGKKLLIGGIKKGTSKITKKLLKGGIKKGTWKNVKNINDKSRVISAAKTGSKFVMKTAMGVGATLSKKNYSIYNNLLMFFCSAFIALLFLSTLFRKCRLEMNLFF